MTSCIFLKGIGLNARNLNLTNIKLFIEISKKCHLRCWDYKSCFYINVLIRIYVNLLVLTMCSVSHKTMTSRCITISHNFNTTAIPLQHDVVSRLDCGKIMWIRFKNMKKLLWKLDVFLYGFLNIFDLYHNKPYLIYIYDIWLNKICCIWCCLVVMFYLSCFK